MPTDRYADYIAHLRERVTHLRAAADIIEREAELHTAVHADGRTFLDLTPDEQRTVHVAHNDFRDALEHDEYAASRANTAVTALVREVTR